MPSQPPSLSPRSCAALLSITVLSIAVLSGAPGKAANRRDVTVSAHKYGFTVSGASGPEIRVSQDDLVRVTFSADDIPHSFTTFEDEAHYRIDRRAEPGKPITFEFRADKVGRFPIKCTLSIDERCKGMEAWLIVEPKK